MLNVTLTYHLTQSNSATFQDLLCNLYVGNVAPGSLTENGCLDYFVTSISVLGDARFNLRSWAFNSVQLRNRAIGYNVTEAENPVQILGLWWDTQSDLIYPSPKLEDAALTDDITKRGILKYASKIFNSLGLISPVTISTKLFLQKL